jgi:hypothetical protein
VEQESERACTAGRSEDEARRKPPDLSIVRHCPIPPGIEAAYATMYERHRRGEAPDVFAVALAPECEAH